eukprot:m51a1_g10799 putative e3 ubiquitin-protein ligase uhrf1 (819) ;mRNA; f:11138-14243
MKVFVQVQGKKERESFEMGRTEDVSSFREAVSGRVSLAPDAVKLIFKGAVMEDGKTLWDYGVGHLSVVALLVRAAAPSSSPSASASSASAAASPAPAPAHSERASPAASPAPAAAAAAAGEAPEGRKETTSHDITISIEKEIAAKLRDAALLATEEEDGVVRMSPQTAEGRKTVQENIPFACQWRVSTVWRVPENNNASRIVTDVAHKPEENMALLKMIDDLFEEIPVYVNEEEGGATSFVPQDAEYLHSGGYFTVAALAGPQVCCGCLKADNEDKLLVCDACAERLWHTYCLDPPLESIPEGDWFCPDCVREREEEGGKGKASKRSKMPSAFTSKKWGGGMSCVGLSSKCDVVDKHHFGKIPGIPVGKHWRYRINVAEAGIHRPPVGGIHGNTKGCFSICLSGGYEDDIDNGDEARRPLNTAGPRGARTDMPQIVYTGSGGRDLTGNKRTAKQSKDQILEKGNLALALNCYAHKNCPDCGERACADCLARWREGKPLRLCRSEKLKSEYAPKAGVRYDGLYKVVDYWQERGQSGFAVYRYCIRRDDDEPAPWTPEGKQKIKDERLDEIEDKETKDERKEKKEKNGDAKGEEKQKRKSKKRSRSETSGSDSETVESEDEKPKKKTKREIKEKSKKRKSESSSEKSDGSSGESGGPARLVRKQRKPVCISIDSDSSDEDRMQDIEIRLPEAAPSPPIAASAWREQSLNWLRDTLQGTAEESMPLFKKVFEIASKAESEKAWLEELMSTLQCTVCLNEKLMPTVIFECGHHFCASCVKRIIKENEAVCPMCRKAIPASIATNELFATVSARFLPYVSCMK